MKQANSAGELPRTKPQRETEKKGVEEEEGEEWDWKSLNQRAAAAFEE